MTRAAAPKRTRKRLARATLLIHLAMTADRWARQISDQEPGVIPFADYPEDDPFVTLCRTYQLKPADLAEVCRFLGAKLERDAVTAGYEDTWDDDTRPAPVRAAPVKEPCTCGHARELHRRAAQECSLATCGCTEWWKA